MDDAWNKANCLVGQDGPAQIGFMSCVDHMPVQIREYINYHDQKICPACVEEIWEQCRDVEMTIDMFEEMLAGRMDKYEVQHNLYRYGQMRDHESCLPMVVRKPKDYDLRPYLVPEPPDFDAMMKPSYSNDPIGDYNVTATEVVGIRSRERYGPSQTFLQRPGYGGGKGERLREIRARTLFGTRPVKRGRRNG